MSPLLLCPDCSTPRVTDGGACPSCGATRLSASSLPSVLGVLGLSFVSGGCFESNSKYGMPDTGGYEDADGDGWSVEDGDCDDTDDTVHPDATETPGDGVDSNCDGSDDT